MARPRSFSSYKKYHSGMVATICTIIILFIIVPLSLRSVNVIDTSGDPDPVVYDPIENFDKHYHRSQKVVAVGDSTMSLSDGVEKKTSSSCKQEEATWVDMLGQDIANISCPGANVSDMLKEVRSSGAIGKNTKRVYISIGTNGYRKGYSTSYMTNMMQKLVREIQKKSTDAEIIFVGYTPVNYNTVCFQKGFMKDARLYDIYHQLANYSMRQIASINDLYFIDIDDFEYDICDTRNTILRLPSQDGTPWHTTSYGHMRIAQRVFDQTGTVENSRLEKKNTQKILSSDNDNYTYHTRSSSL